MISIMLDSSTPYISSKATMGIDSVSALSLQEEIAARIGRGRSQGIRDLFRSPTSQ